LRKNSGEKGDTALKRLAVFCGSSIGASEVYKLAAIELGKELAKRKIGLVYGGASVGLMGFLADTVLQEGGEVIGVMPRILEEKEISHASLTELYVVDSMHERKAKMAELSDGFIALPGGPGTLEEFFEIFTWAQIGLHKKPFGLLNINEYYNPLLSLLEHMVQEQFMNETYQTMAVVEENPAALIEKFKVFQSPLVKYAK